jgi:hypothetical protein
MIFGTWGLTNSIPPFLETTPFSHNTFGLYCGVGVIDWLLRQGYNVSAIAPFER